MALYSDAQLRQAEEKVNRTATAKNDKFITMRASFELVGGFLCIYIF